LVDQLGQDFFRQAPESPGVYLMRDAADEILYIGKAKNLRKRLASYRVANPDRLRRRQLRLLRSVHRIELERCADEASALAREASLLRSIRPRFNRAGTWPGPTRFLSWNRSEIGMQFSVTEASHAGWICYGPLGSSAFWLRAALLRLLWCGIHPEQGLTGLPHGWFAGNHPEVSLLPGCGVETSVFETAEAHLHTLFAGESEPLAAWVRERTTLPHRPFESAALEVDLETILKFSAARKARRE